MLKTIKWAIVRATYSVGEATEYGWIETLTSKDPIEWGEFDCGVFFDNEKDAILFAKEIESLDFPASVVALSFADTTEE